MIKVKAIRPKFDTVVTTADVYENNEVINGIEVPMKGTVKDIQKVIAIGPSVKDVNVGETVKIDLTRFKHMNHTMVGKDPKDGGNPGDMTDKSQIVCDVPSEVVNGQTVFLLSERDISYVVLDYEEVSSDIAVVRNRIITV